MNGHRDGAVDGDEPVAIDYPRDRVIMTERAASSAGIGSASSIDGVRFDPSPELRQAVCMITIAPGLRVACAQAQRGASTQGASMLCDRAAPVPTARFMLIRDALVAPSVGIADRGPDHAAGIGRPVPGIREPEGKRRSQGGSQVGSQQQRVVDYCTVRHRSALCPDGYCLSDITTMIDTAPTFRNRSAPRLANSPL